MLNIPKPTHAYVGRKSCGCCVIVISDLNDDHTAEAVAETIKAGCTIDRVEWQHYVDAVSNEETFMNCPHVEPELQPALFAA